MSSIRRENKENDLLFDSVFDKFKRTMRLMAIKDKETVFAV
jgi:hypothetical protein